MRVMLYAFVAIAVISAGAWIILDNVGFSAANRQAGEAVRLPVPDE